VENATILIAVLVMGTVVFNPRVANARLWRATVTPLASIIGSGFLVLGPILDASFGAWAPAVMAALCLLAWFFGAAVRLNIAALDAGTMPDTRPVRTMETAADWALAFAYVISVAYYLNLFGAFAVSLTPLHEGVFARTVTSAFMLFILAIGWFRGFRALERLEEFSVGLKLSIIAGLIVGLGWNFTGQATGGTLVVNPAGTKGWAAIALTFGLIVTVQGFETSRYLGAIYDAETRIRSMKLAQIVSAAIYMAYILLLAFLFPSGSFQLSETAIIDLMRFVAPVLPALLVAAALGAQFSAAVADTGGSGGLVNELTGRRISARQAYAILFAIGLVLTWTLNVFQIISYASRAFALYYALQAAVAALAAARQPRGAPLAAGYAALALLGFAMAAFGTPVE